MLELKNISFSADGKQILKNINLVIDDAKFVVITGPNGGGKSTLAKVIAGIDRKSTRLNSSHRSQSRMPSSA